MVCFNLYLILKKFFVVCILFIIKGWLCWLILEVIKLVVFVFVWVMISVGVFVILVVRWVVISLLIVFCVGISIFFFR